MGAGNGVSTNTAVHVGTGCRCWKHAGVGVIFAYIVQGNAKALMSIRPQLDSLMNIQINERMLYHQHG